MQTIFRPAAIAAILLAAPAVAVELTEKGAVFCEIEDELVVLGWRTEPSGGITLLGDLYGVTGSLVVGAIIAVDDRRTIVLRDKQLIVVKADGVATGNCRTVTNDLRFMVEALQ
jgi:hypothetical protein